MNIKGIRTYCLTLPGVTEDMPYGPDWVVFRIEGKIFLHISLERRLIAIKLLPERGEELRDKYDAVTPAWHMNKKHWNDIVIENTFAADVIKGWIKESYDLVLSVISRSDARSEVVATLGVYARAKDVPGYKNKQQEAADG